MNVFTRIKSNASVYPYLEMKCSMIEWMGTGL